MRRATHLAMGLASALPVAALAGVPVAGLAACALLGVAGGAMPDYLDLRSIARHVLRHRGVSHAVIMLLAATATLHLTLRFLTRVDAGQGIVLESGVLWPLTASFGLGIASHLLGDSCTKAGIRPWLPVSSRQFWLLPRRLRGASDGILNEFALMISVVLIGLSIGRIIGRW